MKSAFQDRFNLYLVMDFMSGGDLRFHLAKRKTFSETQTKFFVSCIITGLEYLHINNIIHRDIKPENLVFDNKGYLRITDFGISEVLKDDFSFNGSGTPGYMSPEAMVNKSHSIETDYFSLGVVAFECMKGTRPFSGKTRKEIREQILAKNLILKKKDMPED